MSRLLLTRRGLVGRLAGGAALGGGSLLLSGCDKLFDNRTFRASLESAQDLHEATQRLFGRDALAQEFTASQMSPNFRANGSREVADPAYQAQLARGFAQWHLAVGGLVEQPLSISLEALKTLPQRTQITRHDCVEGWSAIGQWTGPQLGAVLTMAKLQPQARYIVFHCADLYHGRPYYESIDLADAFHPQTILAWAMNGRPLEQAHGAPLRLRVERQLGYKHAKFVTRIEAVASLAGIYGGRGGYWEDNGAYAWYAGI
ncbi:molybdopterin-dependent oxidoreductase [Novosphingobium sp. 9]|uniref:molybdopterin-dependent oxidoreductase n=1 Tax=Novosphingobium sp. 9 TaxID=2025349 RepID=UPI0021B6852E|nr:molybdopterin-dependent oxidoreductase [Novosphingobium sp. 9]